MNDPQSNACPSRLKRFGNWLFSWRTIRRALITLAVSATLIAIFYTVENWRGQRAWDKCQRDLIAAGYELDWNKLIPPAIPDAQNIFKAPHMQEWFVRETPLSHISQSNQSTTNFLQTKLVHPNLHYFGKQSRITNTVAATEFLEWSRQFEPEFTAIRQALQRPWARIDCDYSKPYEVLIPNFSALRNLAQTLAQRAHCHVLLNQPEEALADLTFLHGTRKTLLNQPTGQPMTLINAMYHVACAGLYTDAIEDGLQNHVWQEAQLLVLEKQLAELNLPTWVAQAFRWELTASHHAFAHEPFSKLMAMSQVMNEGQDRAKDIWQQLTDALKGLRLRLYDAAPRGWLLQNLAVHAQLEFMIQTNIVTLNTNLQPHQVEAAAHKLETEFTRPSLFNQIARIAIPNFLKALQTTARNQTRVNQARLACALERHRQAQGQYPESLTALTPQFLTAIPNDLIGGQPLKYQRAADGNFILYSVGWNEADDGGTNPKNSDLETGDWVWRSPAH